MRKLLWTCFSMTFFTIPWAATASTAQPDAYPRKPVRLIVGFPPAAATDLIARALAQKLAEQMKNPVIVENRPGAGGNIAYDIGAKAVADGHTLVFNTGGLVQNYALYKKLSYHPLRDFIPVSMVSKSPQMIVANTSNPFGTITEFVAYAKANPGKLSFGSAGSGNATHLAGLLFQRAVGINTLHVPYSGSGPALIALLGGHVQFSTPTVATALPFLTDHRLKALVVMSLKRSPALPDVPTTHETVAPNLEVTSWAGVLVPANTPSAVVKRINAEIRTALSDEKTNSRMALGAEVSSSSPEEYSALIRVELERWTRIVREANLSLD